MSGKPIDILERAAAHVGLDMNTATLLRDGANAIVELSGGIVARIGPSASVAAADRELRVSQWLNASGIPTVEAMTTLPQPIVVEDRPVTWWHLIPDHRPATPAELGAALARLHALDPPTTFELPEYEPFSGLHDRIAAFGNDEREWLIRHYTSLRRQYEALPPPARITVIHGDAWQGNLAVPADGTPIFLDLDKVSRGRPEWDLVQLAVDHADFTRLDTAAYRSFVTGYGGYDMISTPEFRIFADIQELRWVTFAIGLAHRDRAAAAEARHRIACLRGHVAKPWEWRAL
ncbi:phosphotransferase enzyme family protein [Nocardia jiangsuensis]|uniref:Phosphotransferase enzyme family protein n=1 Tax=Nocardia jiangsuensis TaxID=1691563 RepID=A0ABV8DL01_9NOCA